MFDGLEIIGQGQQPGRFERTSFDAKGIENRFQVRRRSQRKARAIRKKSGSFTRGLLSRDYARHVGQRLQPEEPLMSGWRHREICHRGDDPIELQ
jgi:hypothetical protein